MKAQAKTTVQMDASTNPVYYNDVKAEMSDRDIVTLMGVAAGIIARQVGLSSRWPLVQRALSATTVDKRKQRISARRIRAALGSEPRSAVEVEAAMALARRWVRFVNRLVRDNPEAAEIILRVADTVAEIGIGDKWADVESCLKQLPR